MIRAIIVDDEQFALTTLKNKLTQFSNVQVVETYLGSEFNIDNLHNLQVDVIFLDIEMGKQDGLQFADLIHEKFPNIQIVFVTAHDEYAVKAFELESLDYLLKPVTTARMSKTIDRLIERKKQLPSNIDVKKSSFAINCFNEFQFLKDNLPIPFKTVKVKELLAFFVVHQDTPLHRDVLIEALWPNQDYNKSKINFHTCLSHLRKLLKNYGFEDCILLVNHSYTFSLTNVPVDIQQFQEISQSIDVVDKSNVINAERCIELYKGPLFDLNHYDWAEPFTLKFANEYAQLLEKLTDYYANIDKNKMLYYLQLQLPLFPYNDEKIEQCMLLLMEHGYRNEAIKLYVEYKKRLENDLSVSPSKSLENLYKKITRS